MGLLPLEFSDGVTDSPYFRETLQAHERELDLTNTSIKHLVKNIKDLIAAARNLSRAQRTLSDTLKNFNFESIGNSQTDDEMVIANSFKDFARLLSSIEDERDRLLERADEAFLEPIERFRRDQIGSAKEAKKKFEKETTKYCQNLERYLNLSVKKTSKSQLCEADASNEMEKQHFFKAMSEYVLKLHEVNERKKFEFVETVLSFMLGWLTFYHQGHDIAVDFDSVKKELQMRLQRARNNFNMTQEETKSLRQKMINNQQKFKEKFQDSSTNYTRQGYLFLMEKKAFSTSWIKHFCKYEKNSNQLMIHCTQTAGKIVSTEEITVKECIKRSQDTIDRRFCFDIVAIPKDSPNSNSGQNSNVNGISKYSHSPNPSSDNAPGVIFTFQALSEEDYKYWLEALDARNPYPNFKNKMSKISDNSKINYLGDDSYVLDADGYWFIKKCIQAIEARGLDQKGMYRVNGVASRVRTLLDNFLQSKSFVKFDDDSLNEETLDQVDLLPNFNIDSEDFESKTITSALKNYLSNSVEPIMTFKLHDEFISAAKLEDRNLRIEKIHQLVHKLPPINFHILKIVIEHLHKVANLSEKNSMTPSNLGVCFGPTLLRTAKESIAAILDLKFINVIAELLIENYEKFFLTKPEECVSSRWDNGAFRSYINCQIQQRPLPNVPNKFIEQKYNSTRDISPVQSIESNHGNRLLPLNSENVYRSNSQDQLYTVISTCSTSNSSNNTINHSLSNNCNANNGSKVINTMLHPQHSKQYSTYPHHQVAQTTGVASRRALHLSLSSSSPSPSLGSTILTTAHQNLSKYPSQMTYKQVPYNNNSLYGQIRTSSNNQLLQPSVSYQNLHYNAEMSNHPVGSDLKKSPQSNCNLIYNRPMTSIGIIPPNSTYAGMIHSDNDQPDKNKQPKTNYIQLASNSPAVNYLASSLANRSINFSSSSSASLPSTPENSHSQLLYKSIGPGSNVIKPIAPTAVIMNRNPIESSSSSDQMNEMYSNSVHAQSVKNNQSIYGSIGQQQHRTEVQCALPSRKVRTRYVCIGGSESELSFQPNQIITNVRTSREPGWLEGNLNGKTGLVPFNYVEFIE